MKAETTTTTGRNVMIFTQFMNLLDWVESIFEVIVLFQHLVVRLPQFYDYHTRNNMLIALQTV